MTDARVVMTIRITPDTKAALESLARRERRSTNAQLEVILAKALEETK